LHIVSFFQASSAELGMGRPADGDKLKVLRAVAQALMRSERTQPAIPTGEAFDLGRFVNLATLTRWLSHALEA